MRQAGGHLHCGARAFHCRGLSLRSTGSRRADSVVVAHGPSCSAACGIFPDQGSNPCPLHWQADSQPLRHQGSPRVFSIPLHPVCPEPSRFQSGAAHQQSPRGLAELRSPKCISSLCLLRTCFISSGGG